MVAKLRVYALIVFMIVIFSGSVVFAEEEAQGEPEEEAQGEPEEEAQGEPEEEEYIKAIDKVVQAIFAVGIMMLAGMAAITLFIFLKV